MNLAPNISGLYPEICLAAFGIIVLAIDLILKKKDKLPVAITSIIGFVATAVLIFQRLITKIILN